MSACSPMTFPGVTPEVFESLKQELESKGFSVPGPKGVINGPFGITIEYAWNEDDKTLFTQVIDKSFFVPCSQIYDQLQSSLNKFTV